MLLEDDAAIYEYLLGEAYRSVLRQGDVAVDVGANDGLHTMPLAAAVGAAGAVYAFEPVPYHYHRLRTWTETPDPRRARIVLSSNAVSDRTGPCEFFVNVRNAAYYSGLKPQVATPGTAYCAIRATSRTLDDALRDVAAVRFVKIDVDGGEYAVVLGARAILGRCRPVLAFEFGDQGLESYGVSSGRMFRLLDDLGYRVASITGVPIDSEPAFRESSRRQAVWNYVAVHRDQPATFDALVDRLQAIDGFIRRDLGRDATDLRCDVTVDRAHLALASCYDHGVVRAVLHKRGLRAIAPVTMHADGRAEPRIGLRWSVGEAHLTESRVPLPGTILAGESLAVDVPIHPWVIDRVFAPGTYALRIELVSEFVTWVPAGATLLVTVA